MNAPAGIEGKGGLETMPQFSGLKTPGQFSQDFDGLPYQHNLVWSYYDGVG